ncbi:MAG: hypothetical protein EON60_07455 [Alphaproteobacteria bacterium]|nr:MAG: hypothetical protein EON60_07455 [Alphaproteobacteria bacterium]
MANVSIATPRRIRREGRFPDVLLRWCRNTLIAFVVFMALYNPTGLSVSHWLFFSLIPSYTQAEISGYIGRLLSFNTTGTETAVTFVVVLLLAAVAYMSLKMTPGVRTLFFTAVFVMSVVGMIALGMTWYQTIAYAVVFGSAMLMVYTIERYLKIVGSAFLLVIYGALMWALTQSGIFNPLNGTHVSWAVLGFLTILGGTAASTGFILRWWQGRLSVEDEDTSDDHNHEQDTPAEQPTR